MALSIGNPKPISAEEAGVLQELGFALCSDTDWQAGARMPPSRLQAESLAKRTQLEVTLDGQAAVFVIDGEVMPPVEGRITIWEACPYMHGSEQRYVWTVENKSDRKGA